MDHEQASYTERLEKMASAVDQLEEELYREIGEKLIAGGSDLVLGAAARLSVSALAEHLRSVAMLLKNGVEGLYQTLPEDIEV